MESNTSNNRDRTKKIIGLLLVLAIAYFVFTNFNLGDWPKMGMVLQGPKTTCTEIRAPKVMTDTVIGQLKIIDLGFNVLEDERRADITVKNIDVVSGDVNVVIYCSGGEEQGEEKKRLAAGSTGLFSFTDVADCNLKYIIEPESISRSVNKTVYVEDSVCEK